MKLTTTRYARVLLSLANEAKDKTEEGQITKNFFAYLKRHKQMHKAEAILRKVEELDDAEKGIARVNVVTAKPLLPEAFHAASSYAAELFGAKEVIATPRIDSKLIGGVILKTDTALFDASLKTQLNTLGRQLKEGSVSAS